MKEIFPEASVVNECNSSSQVLIEAVQPIKAKVISVAQRDLYRKYRWPAEPAIRQHLEMLKDELENN